MERIIFQNENFQFIEYSICINDAVHFSKSIFEWLDNNPEYKA